MKSLHVFGVYNSVIFVCKLRSWKKAEEHSHMLLQISFTNWIYRTFNCKTHIYEWGWWNSMNYLDNYSCTSISIQNNINNTWSKPKSIHHATWVFFAQKYMHLWLKFHIKYPMIVIPVQFVYTGTGNSTGKQISSIFFFI